MAAQVKETLAWMAAQVKETLARMAAQVKETLARMGHRCEGNPGPGDWSGKRR